MKVFGGKPARSGIDFVISFWFSLLVSVGLPCLFQNLLNAAIAKNGTGGGLFYFPSRPDEILWASGLLLFGFPGLVSLFVLGIPAVGLMHVLGIAMDFDIRVPVSNGTLTVEGNTILGVLAAFVGQVLFWAILLHTARMALVQRWRVHRM